MLLVSILVLAGCEVTPPTLAPEIAQPNTRPARNITSFDVPLRCMDRLLKGKRSIRISSTGIPDHTRRISVGGDDMLINAINRMTRTSRAYVFLDQGLVRDPGLIDLSISQGKKEPRPDFYIRGSISQLDSSVATDEIGLGWEENLGTSEPETSLLNVSANRRQGLSVVSVDLHLVAYPSRRVVPGASVSNSMVVRNMRRRSTSSGVINLDDLGLSVQLDRIESQGQAVRNLIELSAIELVGRHRNVPYWRCLSSIETDAKRNNLQEHVFAAQGQGAALRELQQGLILLGLYDGEVDGKQSREMRRVIGKFQANEQLVVNGIADFDTLKRLRIRLAEKAREAKRASALNARPAASTKPKTEKGNTFRPITDYLSP
ncbi:peptidoglycan-binding domain-containing protein [Cognatishimia sp.]|uniref:peptidoglycan-binding domain-containing protein n=1 Tax=Cognatishimia sp. TaxID=2211648 RepID=UPI003513FF98|nr:peptidoglycan-binding protein [Cognatishimia sp.]